MLLVFYKFDLEWNPNVKPRYGMVSFDTAEIISMEAAFPQIDIFCVILAGSNHGTGGHFLNTFTMETHFI